jgi:Tfp pilus assembly protein PilF
LRIGAFLQEVELALLADGQSVRGVRPSAGQDPVEVLFVPYLRRAQEVPTSEAWVLAARLATDPDQAGVLLEQAIAIDGDNPWAHYGMAWLHASRQRYSEARKALEQAFAIDPGHLPSIRLDGALQARAGEEGRAVQAFESWLERSVEDPAIDPRERATVRLDLAILLVLEDEPAQALKLLEAVEPSVPQREAQVELVRAAAYHALGAMEEAQRAVRFAREASPEELFVSVDEALLAARRGDPDGERAAWAQALAIAEREPSAPADAEAADFRSVLVRLQALTRLARLGAGVP